MTSHPMIDPAIGLEASLRTFAKGAAAKASELLEQGQPRSAAHAASWMRAAREALEAARIADEPLSEGERGAFEQLVKHQREQIATARQALSDVGDQRDDLAAFLGTLAGELESADTHPARRFAVRIRRELAAIFPDAQERQDAAEAAGEDVPAEDRPEGGST